MLAPRFRAAPATRPTAISPANAERQACRAVPPIVPEFAQVLTFTSARSLDLPVDSKQCLTSCIQPKASCGNFVIPCVALSSFGRHFSTSQWGQNQFQ